ncbi:hypothetical protein Back2_14050 [Nocardioides baekrokdamisoli]|uniref:Uncharacterized protein n=1 Tax=Nocardioides baekrokdamisoli TaxID=1804624 RepID=A0A3G9J0F5_9ACTN|nr:hypothetical protein [Nocardioides baekrokdamisoli]BBH17118.1 hypothetical protein Back2_14050 [Nocardioides baekrokdamisoli]
MKKIAAVVIAGGLTAGVTAMSQPAEAYGMKPTLCQILGAGHNASSFKLGRTKTYPAQFFVKAPGAVANGSVHVTYSGAARGSLSLPLAGGTVVNRVTTGKGKLTVKIGYSGSAGFGACSASFSTTIK